MEQQTRLLLTLADMERFNLIANTTAFEMPACIPYKNRYYQYAHAERPDASGDIAGWLYIDLHTGFQLFVQNL